VSREKNEKKQKDRAPVKVPRGPLGRMIFFGGQAGAVLGAVRSIKDARAKGDRLALAHGLLSSAVLAVTAAIAVRSIRQAKAEQAAADAEAAEPLLLTAGGGK
jgi:hypothetical protein